MRHFRHPRCRQWWEVHRPAHCLVFRVRHRLLEGWRELPKVAVREAGRMTEASLEQS